MGDQQAWGQLNGGNLEGNPNPSTISRDQWDRVEDRTAEIMYRIQPTEVSETRRKAVIDYIQRLIRGCLGAERGWIIAQLQTNSKCRDVLVRPNANITYASRSNLDTLVFPFGSVPLKTYLPDGDIDLSAFSTSQNVEDLLANDVRLVLEGEEQNKASEFEVRDVQYINAEVKLVKCLVQNIVVDISVNQLGGLCTLCFLEQVDRIIAKQHLFKRSIILIKAWCYYESRILGAHHGLISTYALETLVLYIFQHFHSSLHGPLEVLYRFLDYFSQFNWDSYCVTLNGPVSLSVLPEMTVESVENDGYDLLLSEELLKNCTEIYSVPAKLTDTPRSFPLKHLNIVDPLKENNNLGRSVSRGNFFRIRSAFGYGARKLGRILLSAETDITEELTKFFMNTLDRHGTGQRPDVQNSNTNIHEPSFGITAFSAAASPDAEGHEKGLRLPKADVSTAPAEQVTEHCDSVQNVSESGLLMEYNASIPEEQAVVSRTSFGNEKDLVSSMIFAQTSGKGTIVESSHEPSNSPSERISEMTQIQFSRANTFPGWGVGHVLDPSGICTTSEKKVPFWHWASQGQAPFPLEDAERSAYAANNAPQFIGSNSGSNLETTVSYGSAGTLPDTSTLVKYTGLRTGSPGVCESVGQLSDLTGELDNHKQSLACGRWYYESAMFGPVLPFRMVAGSYLQSHPLYDSVYQTPVPKNMYQYLPSNGMISGPPFPPTNRFYHRNPTMFSGGFSNEDALTKHRGTGTYFPNVNQHVHRDRQSVGRGRHHATPNHSTTQRPRNNGRGVTVGAEYIASGHRVGDSRLESSSGETPGQELLRPSFNASSGSDMASWPKLPSSTVEPVHPFGGGHGGPRPTMRAALGGNVRPPSTEGLEFGSLGSLPRSPTPKPDRRRHEPDSGSMRASVPSQPNSSAQRPVLALNIEKPSHSYHMKDEDFPPLSV